MFNRKNILPAIGMALCFAIHPQNASAEHPKSSEFLTYSEGQREWWFSGTFETMGHVVSLKNEEQGNCIWNFYFKAPEQRRSELEAAMRQHPDHSPTAISIALVQRACGKFNE